MALVTFQPACQSVILSPDFSPNSSISSSSPSFEKVPKSVSSVLDFFLLPGFWDKRVDSDCLDWRVVRQSVRVVLARVRQEVKRVERGGRGREVILKCKVGGGVQLVS